MKRTGKGFTASVQSLSRMKTLERIIYLSSFLVYMQKAIVDSYQVLTGTGFLNLKELSSCRAPSTKPTCLPWGPVRPVRRLPRARGVINTPTTAYR
jgi:hypothetical protein